MAIGASRGLYRERLVVLEVRSGLEDLGQDHHRKTRHDSVPRGKPIPSHKPSGNPAGWPAIVVVARM